MSINLGAKCLGRGSDMIEQTIPRESLDETNGQNYLLIQFIIVQMADLPPSTETRT